MNYVKEVDTKTNTLNMNSKNSRRSSSHTLLFNLKDKMNLKRRDKYAVLSNLGICYTWKNIKSSYKNHKFKISNKE